jgi:hypothetical protein
VWDVGTTYTRILAALAAAALLAGCGILPRVARQTTAAAMAPISTTARAVSRSLEVTSANLAASAAATERTSRQVRMTAAQARAAARTAEQRRQQFARAAERSAQARKPALTRESEPFDVLPAAVLARLTEDQAALQRAAQKEAFTAPVGEEIYWEDSGRTGAAMAEDETPMGSFVCRTFVQTLRLDDGGEERGTAFACRTPDGVWEASLARTEMTP